MGDQHARIGSDPVTGLEDDEVPDDDLGGVDHGGRPASTNGCPLGKERHQSFRRSFGAFLLHEGEDAVEGDHGDDGDGDLRQPGDHRQRGGHPQHDGEEVHELCPEHRPPPGPPQ